MSGVSFHQSCPWLPCASTVPSVSRNTIPAPSGGRFLSAVIVCACERLQTASKSVITARNSFFVKTDLRLEITVNIKVRKLVAPFGFDWEVQQSARTSTLNSLSEPLRGGTNSGTEVLKILLHGATCCQSICGNNNNIAKNFRHPRRRRP